MNGPQNPMKINEVYTCVDADNGIAKFQPLGKIPLKAGGKTTDEIIAGLHEEIRLLKADVKTLTKIIEKTAGITIMLAERGVPNEKDPDF
jgi:hypothetical protein